jgi:iron complex transport system substrate-binding protein
MLQVGQAADREAAAQEAIAGLHWRVDRVSQRAEAMERRPRSMLLEWIDPPFSAGHWNPELVRLAGGQELLGREGQPSRRLDWNEIAVADPEVMLIACCGFPVERTLVDLPLLRAQPGWTQLSCVRSGRVYVTDGSAYFNRPGPRLVDSLEILAHAIDCEVHPLPPEVGRNLFRPI